MARCGVSAGQRTDGGPGGERQSNGKASGRVMKHCEPSHKHARGRQHALDPKIDHADKDYQRFPGRHDNEEAGAREQSLVVSSCQKGRREKLSDSADGYEESEGPPDTARPTH